MNKRFLVTLTSALTLAPAALFAHPGHGAAPPSSFLHPLVEPGHAVWLVALAGFGLALLLERSLRGRSLR